MPNPRLPLSLALFLLTAAPRGAAAQPPDLGGLIDEGARAQAAATKSQERVEALDDATRELVKAYRATLEEVESLRTFAAQVETMVEAQGQELETLGVEIENTARIVREITPLMSRMLDALEAFIALDTPFLLRERRERVARLREMMGRADVTLLEKYRRIAEAYQIENEYGRTIEAYQGELDEGAGARAVSFLRIGRLLLVYQTLDGEEAGMWDQRARRWVPLGSEYHATIRKGIRIAREQIAPELIRLPVPAPEAVR